MNSIIKTNINYIFPFAKRLVVFKIPFIKGLLMLFLFGNNILGLCFMRAMAENGKLITHHNHFEVIIFNYTIHPKELNHS